MEQIYTLMKLFGERYIYCDNATAARDAMPKYRDDLVDAYTAIMHFVLLVKDGENND